MPRAYTKRQRADSEAATRARIVEATMSLHEELGPRRTTISAIAERAGVQRLTVYRHFPDETALFQACTSCWLERNPPPSPPAADSADSADSAEAPETRCEALLTALYGYFRRTRGMWTVSFRDEAVTPAVQEPMAQFRAYLAGLADELEAAFGAPSRLRRAALGHVVMFSTWADLAEQGLDDPTMAHLATTWVLASS
ncbi:MAG: TetR/AcrR family transcriptional regulator [Phenylobacterium sp.]|uniref:TetR/AcrR family transcriptional regulator n=1 Tax=Phenylobacterium sp. TaxID=1871053 RepID=UPI003918EBA3